jgi:hypothetical protein
MDGVLFEEKDDYLNFRPVFPSGNEVAEGIKYRTMIFQ